MIDIFWQSQIHFLTILLFFFYFPYYTTPF